MSREAILWASKTTTGSAGRKAVLNALAWRHHEDTGSCKVSVERLARELEMGESTVRRLLIELVDAGLIARDRERRGGKLGLYVFRLSLLDSSGSEEPLPLDLSGGLPLESSGQEVEVQPVAVNPPTSGSQGRSLARRESWKVDRKTVTDGEDMLARAVLAEWNAQTGQRLTSRDWIAMIVMRVREHPDLSLVEHGEMIAQALHDPWWKGSPSPNVVYGNGRVFERAMQENRGGPRKEPRRYGRGVTMREVEDAIGRQKVIEGRAR